jgi:hypothetical protein
MSITTEICGQTDGTGPLLQVGSSEPATHFSELLASESHFGATDAGCKHHEVVRMAEEDALE